MKKITLTLLVIASALFLSSCGGDQEFNLNNDIDAKVDGYIFDAVTKSPLQGVKVTISNKVATTNDAGYYLITGLATGKYPVKLEKEGYASYLSVGSISIDGKNYYGDAIQTCEAFSMYPTSKKLEVTFRFRVYNPDTGVYDWYNAPQGLKVKVKYTNNNILDVIPTATTNNSGKITINNVAELQNMSFLIDQVIGSDQYYLDRTITYSDLENYEYTIRVEISKSTAPGNIH
jgi:5-hydroxyisourate hydrolase-like protein (transthyretin family)